MYRIYIYVRINIIFDYHCGMWCWQAGDRGAKRAETHKLLNYNNNNNTKQRYGPSTTPAARKDVRAVYIYSGEVCRGLMCRHHATVQFLSFFTLGITDIILIRIYSIELGNNNILFRLLSIGGVGEYYYFCRT